MPTDSFRDFVLEQLTALDGLRCRKMFGGRGLYYGGQFFGIMYGGRLYFKTHPDTLPDYLSHHSAVFTPSEKQVLKNYRGSGRYSGRRGAIGCMGDKGGTTMSSQNMKQAIRKNILAQREQLPADTRAAYSAAITARLMQLPEYQQADAVLGYMNFGAEFASKLWVERALADGKRLALPKVNRHTNHLDLYWVEDPENQLAAGLWEIREPVVERCERLGGLNEVEFVLLPGAAFARDGARLGYGGGFYDKLLADLPSDMAHRPVLAAAAFALQIVEFIPQEPTDVKVEWIITEQEIIACPVDE